MKLETISPIKALNKAYYKQSISRNDIELFKTQLKRLFARINEKESEENFKNIVSDFLKDTYYKEKYEINTKGRNDLVIHTGKNFDSPVGVIIEAKRPGSPEMISKDKPNNKALHELMLYYIVERFEHNNKELKYLVATDIYNWYIFDAVLFERFFAKNQNFVDSYTKWKNGMLVDKTTEWFYKEIAKDHLYNNIDDITCTYFNLKLYEKKLDKAKPEDDEKLADLYKILAPVHLLKQPFINDSNNLNKEFYNELLHILGLEEDKNGSKKLIQRKDNGHEGSLLENTINILELRGRINKIKDSDKYGTTEEEKTYNIALELCITWLNRILFLKLLEGQLIKYNRNKDYAFLNNSKIKDFDALNELFFEVLARQTKDRKKSVKEIYKNIPYLNSSLFESTDLEDETIQISDLKDRLELPLYSNTVIKDEKGKKITGSKLTLHYLFEFLEAYDFATDSSKKIQEQNKTIINASVLGLIFEKLNGYKDGSYFTPGYITMYICSETIRRTVVQKFNEKYNWFCANLDELYNKIENVKEANDIINNLKICDPAVGSGHFLVSALNEIIAIKSDLEILCDRNGRKIKDWKAIVSNDELLIFNVETDDIFEYQLPISVRGSNKQVLQEALFHEKQTIIENCLFGVDINPNSVKISRLRLWIELLKHSYYTFSSGYKELETLPNIDINIKEGNSLLNRFDIYKTNFTHADRSTFEIYKTNVSNYKNEKNKNERTKIKAAIDKTKSMFKGFHEYPFIKENEKLTKLTKELYDLNITNLFGEDNKTDKDKLKIAAIETKINSISNDLKVKIREYDYSFANAFEWRFEYPEVLDNDGKFVGFDVIIANPPYKTLHNTENSSYELTKGNNNTYVAFIELAKRISPNGLISMIIPNTWLSGNNFIHFRGWLLQNKSILKLVQLPYDIFEVYVDTVILQLDFLNKNDEVDFFKFKIREEFDTQMHVESINISKWLEDENKTIFLDNTLNNLLKKYRSIKNNKLGDIAEVQRGSLPPSNEEMFNTNTDKKTELIPWFNHQVYRYSIEKKNDVYVNYNNLRENKPIELYKCEKILGRQLISRQFRLQFTYLNKFFGFKKNLYAIYDLNTDYEYLYLLAILNSRFFSFVQIQFNTSGQRDDFPSFSLSDFRNFLIPKIDKNDQKKFVKLANEILAIKAKDSSANVDNFENEIDRLVYELYGLTEEEIKIVEGG